MSLRAKLKSKEDRDAQWVRLAWKIAARRGLPVDDAMAWLANRAVEFWVGRMARNFLQAVVGGDEPDPYLERAEKYKVLANPSPTETTELW